MMENARPKYRGVFCPAVTPLDAEGRIDLEAAGKLYDHLIAGGLDGIVVLGSIGEFQALESEEKRRLIRFAADHAGRRCKVIAGTGGTVMREVVDLTRFAEDAGADAAMIIPPYYFPVGDVGLLNYYGAVADAVEMDILLYSFPARTGYELPVEVVAELADSRPNVMGIKDTIDSISHTRAIVNAVAGRRSDFAVLSGFDEYIYVNLLGGGAGTVNGLTNLVPGLFRDAFHAFDSRDVGRMHEIQMRINTLMPIYTTAPNFVATFKYAASLIIPGMQPHCAPPERSLTPREQHSVQVFLGEAGITG